MRLRFKPAVAAVLVAGALAPAVAASPSADLTAIGRDYASGRNITPCRFTVAQLQGARTAVTADVETYAAGLTGAIDRELKRWKDHACTPKKIAAAAGGKLRIVSVRPKGGARAESVTIQNAGRTTVNLRGYALRDAGDHTLKFRATKLKRGAKLRVVTGCAKGSKRAVRRGTRYYFCRSKQVWDDAGDTVELLGRGGGLLSRKKYP
jgi:lamin tail-like protein